MDEFGWAFEGFRPTPSSLHIADHLFTYMANILMAVYPFTNGLLSIYRLLIAYHR